MLGPGTLSDVEAATKELGLTLLRLPVGGPDELDAALTRARKEGAAGVIVPADAVMEQHRETLVTLILKHRLPAIYWRREYVEAGGLMTYGTNVIDLRRRAAQYVDKILRGAKPADLPVEQPTKFELVINLKTAKALGLTSPPSLLARADQVIE